MSVLVKDAVVQVATEIVNADYTDKFGVADYSVVAAVLLVSAGIGIYYGYFGNKNATNDDFLMAGRNMSVFPVALSLACSFVSAVTLLGNPVEVYYYGSQYLLVATGFIPISLALAFLFVPVFFELQLTSVYEYFELRFSRVVRVCMSVLSIVYLILLMSIWVYGPALAINEVAGINTYLMVGLTFVVCIFYSSLGGLKAVLWTDAMQAMIMLGSMIAVVAKGISDIGGMDIIWERARISGRIEFLNFDPDPRTRHTFWTSTIGGYLMWIPLYAATQSQIQRYLSVSTLKKARLTILINMFALMAVISLCFLAGMVIYGKYYDCDPIGGKAVAAADQILPRFVMETLGDYPGLPGLFVAGLTGASLSSVSSALNSLSAIITEDYVKKWRPNLTDVQMSRISKIVSVVCGSLSFAFVFAAEFMGDIFPIALTMVGMFLGPTLGLFSLGMFFPWANTYGSLAGTIAGIALVLTISAGSTIYQDDIPNQKLNLTTSGCVFKNSSEEFTRFHEATLDWKDDDDTSSGWIKLFSLAPTWYAGLGNFSTIILGLLLSALTVKLQKIERIPRRYLSIPVLSLYEKVLPQSWVGNWVEPKSENIESKVVLDMKL